MGFLLLSLLIFLVQHPYWCLLIIFILIFVQVYWDRVCEFYQVYQKAKVTANEAFVSLKTTETVEEFIEDWDSRNLPQQMVESTICAQFDLHKVSEDEFTGVLVHQVDIEGNLIEQESFNETNLTQEGSGVESLSTSMTSSTTSGRKSRNVNGSQRPTEVKVTDSNLGKIQKLIDFAELYGNLDKEEKDELARAKKVIIPAEEIFQFLSTLNQLSSDKNDKVATNQVDNIKRQFESIVNTYSQQPELAGMNQVL